MRTNSQTGNAFLNVHYGIEYVRREEVALDLWSTTRDFPADHYGKRRLGPFEHFGSRKMKFGPQLFRGVQSDQSQAELQSTII